MPRRLLVALALVVLTASGCYGSGASTSGGSSGSSGGNGTGSTIPSASPTP